MFPKTIWLVLAAAMSATVVFFLIQASWIWDHPETKPIELYRGAASYHQKPVAISITCRCPSTLVESHNADLNIDVTLERAPGTLPQGPPAGGPGSSPAGTASPTPGGKAENFNLWAEFTNASVKLPGNSWIGSEEQLEKGINQHLVVEIKPTGEGQVSVAFEIWSTVPNGNWDKELASGTWTPYTRATFVTASLPFVIPFAVFGSMLGVLLWINRRNRQLRNRTERNLADALSNRGNAPNDTHIAWEVARIKLEAYFDRNLIQVNLVFWLAVFVMAVGFIFVLSGIFLAFRTPKDLAAPGLAAASGIITQFIGATVMVIYRSTMRQANEFMSVLERINTVGMAVNELDRIPEALSEVKNDTRCRFVELLLGGNIRTQSRLLECSEKEPELSPNATRL